MPAGANVQGTNQLHRAVSLHGPESRDILQSGAQAIYLFESVQRTAARGRHFDIFGDALISEHLEMAERRHCLCAAFSTTRRYQCNSRGASHARELSVWFDTTAEVLSTGNETNTQRLWGVPNPTSFVKDAFHDYVINVRLKEPMVQN